VEPPAPAMEPQPLQTAPVKTVVKTPPPGCASQSRAAFGNAAPRAVETPRPQPALVAENPGSGSASRLLKPGRRFPLRQTPSSAPLPRHPQLRSSRRRGTIEPVNSDDSSARNPPVRSHRIRQGQTVRSRAEVVVKVKVNVDATGKCWPPNRYHREIPSPRLWRGR